MESTNTRVGLVTGANRGLGFEISRQLALKGMIVLMAGRNMNQGTEATANLSGQGLNVHFILIDVADFTTIEAGLGRIKEEYQRLDVLVNNAGILVDSETVMLELSISVLQNTLETNAFGPFLLSQVSVPLMKANHYGRIVNISSTMGSLSNIANPDSSYGQIKSPAYRLSKTLLNGITVLLAKELQGSNILVNSACPGWVRTNIGGDQAPL
jgi:NAD(P)-dependent dehydrogenase (short-subunit alcohol dehydrogenase family)